jgi:hypothetical protein
MIRFGWLGYLAGRPRLIILIDPLLAHLLAENKRILLSERQVILVLKVSLCACGGREAVAKLIMHERKSRSQIRLLPLKLNRKRTSNSHPSYYGYVKQTSSQSKDRPRINATSLPAATAKYSLMTGIVLTCAGSRDLDPHNNMQLRSMEACPINNWNTLTLAC